MKMELNMSQCVIKHYAVENCMWKWRHISANSEAPIYKRQTRMNLRTFGDGSLDYIASIRKNFI